jgi:hypothetical protein
MYLPSGNVGEARDVSSVVSLGRNRPGLQLKRVARLRLEPLGCHEDRVAPPC